MDRLAILTAAHPRKLSQGLHHPGELRKSWYFFFDLPELPETVVHAEVGRVTKLSPPGATAIPRLPEVQDRRLGWAAASSMLVSRRLRRRCAAGRVRGPDDIPARGTVTVGT